MQTGSFAHDFPIFSVGAAISRPYGAPAANVPIRIFAVDIAHCASERLRDQRASVERIRNRFPRRGRCLHRPEPAAGGSVRRKRSGDAGLSASGGELFTAEKFPKCAGGCGPRSPMGPRGVHPRERHCASSCCPPSRPAPYCLPLPGFARASRIGWPLRLQHFSQRPHKLPQNRGLILHTAVFVHDFPIFSVGARLARMLGPMPRSAA